MIKVTNIVSAGAAQRLQQLIDSSPGQPARPAKGGPRGRIPVLVRCTSATAGGEDGSGSGSGDDAFDECYPGVIVDPRSSEESPQPELGAVWLTVLGDGGQAVTPTAGAVYLCLLAGELDIDGTRRLRAFAADEDPCNPRRCVSGSRAPISHPNPASLCGDSGSGGGAAEGPCEPLVLTMICASEAGPFWHIFDGRALYVTTKTEHDIWVAANPGKSWCCEGGPRLGEEPCGLAMFESRDNGFFGSLGNPITNYINFLNLHQIEHEIYFCCDCDPDESPNSFPRVLCATVLNGTGSFEGVSEPVQATTSGYDGQGWPISVSTGTVSISGKLVKCGDALKFHGTITSTAEHPTNPEDFPCGCVTTFPICPEDTATISQEVLESDPEEPSGTLRITTPCGTVDIEYGPCSVDPPDDIGGVCPEFSDTGGSCSIADATEVSIAGDVDYLNSMFPDQGITASNVNPQLFQPDPGAAPTRYAVWTVFVSTTTQSNVYHIYFYADTDTGAYRLCVQGTRLLPEPVTSLGILETYTATSVQCSPLSIVFESDQNPGNILTVTEA